MKSKFLTTQALREADILKELTNLLTQTIETEGQLLWAKLFQEKTAQDAPFDQWAVTLTQAKSALIRFQNEVSQKSLKGKINLALQIGAQSAALLSAATVGLILPQNNVILFKKDQKQDAITLERASLFLSELFLDWMNSILEKSLQRTNSIENVAIRFEIQKQLEITRKITQNAKSGLKRGSVLRKKTGELFRKLSKRPRKDIRIPLESGAFIALESFLNQTLKTKRDTNDTGI